MTNFIDVQAFHTKFNLMIGENPHKLSDVRQLQRIQFMQEELQEFTTACVKGDLAGQADALIDLVYVAMGTAVMMGLPWDELWADVQRANMEKEKGRTHRGVNEDVAKPKGWTPPKTQEILRANS